MKPRHRRYRTEIRRLIGLGLDEAFAILVGLYVCGNAVVKGPQVPVVLAPNIGKGLVLFVKDRITGHDDIPVPQPAVAVKAHAEFPVFIDGPHDRVQHKRKKPQPPLFLKLPQRRNIDVGRQRIPALDLTVIIVEMVPAGPRFPVDEMKHTQSSPNYPDMGNGRPYTIFSAISISIAC